MADSKRACRKDMFFSMRRYCEGDGPLQVLEYFHSRNRAVMGIQSANIMMTDQKRLYLVDFGSEGFFSYSAL
ncbi:MAG: hypothetical protein ACLRIT_12240 [Blautia sp.]